MREARRGTRSPGTPGVLLLVALCVTLPCCTSRSSGAATPITYSGSGVEFGCGTPVVNGSAIGIDVKLAITDKHLVSLNHWHATATITNHSDVEYWVAPIGALGVTHSKVSSGPIPDMSAHGGGPGPRLRAHSTLTVPIGLGAAACVPTKDGNLLPTPATVDLAAVVTLWDINQKVGRNVRSEPVRVVIH